MIENQEPISIETLVIEYEGADDLLLDYRDNLSTGQVFLDTTRELPVGARVQLKLSFLGLRRPIEIMGVVRWPRDQGAQPGLGIEISDTTERQSLTAVIDRIRERDPRTMARVVRILVAEDNPHVARLIRNGLRGASHRELADRLAFDFCTAQNGQEALEFLQVRTFDALIVDMYLPVLDGAHVITCVRADDTMSRLPILAVSAGGPSAKDAALRAGADHFISKPMRLREITEVMDTMLGLRP